MSGSSSTTRIFTPSSRSGPSNEGSASRGAAARAGPLASSERMGATGYMTVKVAPRPSPSLAARTV
ncbi:MAG TPA: hypothetical protein VNZ44_17080, partial [Pyrinomonadaceae bacterium]|nr:hypothetical protein [Pyrinomonadaceae bacterium]